MKRVMRRVATTPAEQRRQARQRAALAARVAVRGAAFSGLTVRAELPPGTGPGQQPTRRATPAPALTPVPRLPRQREPVDLSRDGTIVDETSRS
jgi:hypothetical protein